MDGTFWKIETSPQEFRYAKKFNEESIRDMHSACNNVRFRNNDPNSEKRE